MLVRRIDPAAGRRVGRNCPGIENDVIAAVRPTVDKSGDRAGPRTPKQRRAIRVSVLVGGILRLIVTDILAHLDEKDRFYFRETREKRLGAALEAVTANRETDVVAFRKTLDPVRTLLAAQPYFGGELPAYADYAVFGCFQWARCISSFPLLTKDDPVWAWRDRLLSAFDGFAGKALGYPL
jgi:glutathione S-transferase